MDLFFGKEIIKDLWISILEKLAGWWHFIKKENSLEVCPFCPVPCGYPHCPYTKEENDDNFTDNLLRIDQRDKSNISNKDGEGRE